MKRPPKCTQLERIFILDKKAECLEEHKKRPLYPDKSAVAQHTKDNRHSILLDKFTILEHTFHYGDNINVKKKGRVCHLSDSCLYI